MADVEAQESQQEEQTQYEQHYDQSNDANTDQQNNEQNYYEQQNYNNNDNNNGNYNNYEQQNFDEQPQDQQYSYNEQSNANASDNQEDKGQTLNHNNNNSNDNASVSPQSSETDTQVDPNNVAVFGVTNIFISRLPNDFRDDDLFNLFSDLGEIESAKVILDYKTGNSKGYGFVKFKESNAAKQAIQKYNGKQIKDKVISVEPAESPGINPPPTPHGTPSPNLYIKGIPIEAGITEEYLVTLFGPFGDLEHTKVLTEPSTGLPKGQAFVKFKEQSAADEAIKALNGSTPPNGLPNSLIVRYADTQSEKKQRKIAKPTTPTGRPIKGNERFNPYGRPQQPPGGYQQPPQQNYGGYGQDQYGGYAQYGNYGNQQYPNQQYGGYGQYGNYGNQQYGAYNANQYNAGYGNAYNQPGGYQQPYGGYQQPQQQPGAPQHHQPASTSASGVNATPQNTVFIYGLTPTVDETALQRLFVPFGPIANVKIVRDQATGNAKGYGFVTYTNNTGASSAVNGMNGYQIAPNKYLSVTFKK